MSTSVGLLGGSFDPVHRGHLQLAEEAQRRFGLEKIMLIPANQSPFKKESPPMPPEHRLAMLECAIQDRAGWMVSDIEIKRDGVSYTADTLSELHQHYPGNEWYFIMGLDTFMGFADWARVEEILSLSRVVVASRPGYDIKTVEKVFERLAKNKGTTWEIEPGIDGQNDWVQKTDRYRISFFPMTPMPMSSSEIRQRIGSDPLIKKMLPPQVDQYIMKHLLYQKA